MDTYIVTLRGRLVRPGTEIWAVYAYKPIVRRRLRRLTKQVSIVDKPVEGIRTTYGSYTYRAEFELDGIEVEANSAEDAIKRASAKVKRVLQQAVCRYGRLTIY